MKKKAKAKSKLHTDAQPSAVRVIRITEEVWAAKFGSLGRRQPVEPEEFFDRALRLDSRAKAS
jgi:hypothetical protein